MARSKDHDGLRRAGRALLEKLRSERPQVDIDSAGRERLVRQLGTTEQAVDELLTLPVREEE